MKFIVELFLFVGLMCGLGCGKVVQRAVNEVRGAESKVSIVPGMTQTDFSSFASVKFLSPKTELGGLVSTQYLAGLARQLDLQIASLTDQSAHRTLTIEPAVMWYHRGGAGDVLPVKFVVILVYLKEGEADLGRVQIWTRSKATGKGDEDLAESAATALVKFLRENGFKLENEGQIRPSR